MPEAGGPTTQSGIFYQNSVAAMYIGRLCDEAPRPDAERIVRVQVEAPEHVDDTIVWYANSCTVYIQSKESIRLGDEAWQGLWRAFATQYRAGHFVRRRDRLRLHLGEPREPYTALRELCARAQIDQPLERWLGSLSHDQRRVKDSIARALGTAMPTDDEAMRALLAHVDVIVWQVTDLDDRAPLYMPRTNVPQLTLYRLIRDRIGRGARYREAFEARTLREQLRSSDRIEFQTPPDIEELYAAARGCGGLLRQHKHTLGATGLHINRRITQDIVEWAADGSIENRTAMLLDSAGMGKTVVMRDTMTALEGRGITVLAIKADQQLSGVTGAADLQQKLNFPQPIEQVVGRLAALGQVVVILDQVDALSLSLARDQRALDEVLALVARLRDLPGVTILLSCRTFDRNTDPRLNRLEVGRTFSIPSLDEDEVTEVLERLGVNPDALTPGTRELIRIPLHLDLLARVVDASGADTTNVRGTRSLQELYGLVWEAIVLRPNPDGPTAEARVSALRRIVERMDRDQRTSAPRSMFAMEGMTESAEAADWLASSGILVAGTEEWSLLHQTFFDYCYARFFVENGRDLASHVLGSDQGLFLRPQVVHVLAYMRGTRHPHYLRAFTKLLHAETLRTHLRDLLLRWYGALLDPTDEEWVLARRLFLEPATRVHLLRAMGGNPAWFSRIATGPLSDWLAGDAGRIDNEVIPYLRSLVDSAQEEIAAVADRWAFDVDPWRTRLRSLFWNVRNWEAPQIVALYERFLRSSPIVELNESGMLDEIAKRHPAAGARLVRLVLDASVEEYSKREGTDSDWISRRLHDKLTLLDESSLVPALKLASNGAPRAFLEQIIPWIERVSGLVSAQLIGTTHLWYPGDPLSLGLVTRGDKAGRTVTQACVTALVTLSRIDAAAFRSSLERLAALGTETPQRIIAETYRELAPDHAEEACAFLLEDPRRLQIGDDDAWHTRKLLEAIAPSLPPDALARLEDQILTHSGRAYSLFGNITDLARRGRDQLFLLQSLPRASLGEKARRQLAELERKFPGHVPASSPQRAIAVFVGSPIGEAAAEKMSDAAWLGAMTKYTRGTTHRDHRFGGARELSRVLQNSVKADPARFFHLAERIPADLDASYANAFLDGLAESSAPPEWVFALTRKFASVGDHELRRYVLWALRRIIEGGATLPRDLIELLSTWIKTDAGVDEARWGQEDEELEMGVSNSVRGSAFETVMLSLGRDESADALEARWAWVAHAATDPSIVLRAAGLQQLIYMIREDQLRAIDLFEILVDGKPKLREVRSFHEFLYWANFGQITRLARYVEDVMSAEKSNSRKRGAELAVLSRISTGGLRSREALNTAERLAEAAVTGFPEWRRGAAHIYSYNLADGPTELCVAGLRRLLNDDDEGVRQEADGFVVRLREEHFVTLRAFLMEFAASRALQESASRFTEFLWENGALDPILALDIVDLILANDHPSGRHGGFGVGDDLVRLVLHIYTDPTSDPELRERAMTSFDVLIDRYAGYAWSALDEWDRR